jgi:hypothetical protein
MASQSSDARALDPDRIAFDVERLTRQDDLLIVSGRWYGVRGRRFVRPTLLFETDGSQRQVLADLEHKPWAAEDGELWRAAFAVDGDPRGWERIELAVAPDITVLVAPGKASGRAARATSGVRGDPGRSSDGESSSPRARSERAHRPPGRSAGDLAYENDRLKARLTALEQAHQRERERREAAEKALEREREEGLRLRSGLGQTKAELDLARTAEQELAATLAELEAIRRREHDTGQKLEASRHRERDAGRELERARDVARQLHEARAAAQHAERSLGSAQRALTEQRVENKRLRDQLARRGAGEATPPPAQAAPPEPEPKREPVLGARSGQGLTTAGHGLTTAPETVTGPEPPPRPEVPRGERPVNPALTGINPTARLIAVCVVLAALVAVVLVIRTTL